MTKLVIKERPILMSAPSVRALLAGTKTQTRRAIKPQPVLTMTDCLRYLDDQRWCWMGPQRDVQGNPLPVEQWKGGWPDCSPEFYCPCGKPGDRLWVRETFFSYTTTVYSRAGKTVSPEKYIYAADGSILMNGEKWKSAIFLPRAASRITLEVTDVRVQRLQEISVEDSLAEGITHSTLNDPRVEYRWLWESINGPGSWDTNPWVWAVSFKRVDARGVSA